MDGKLEDKILIRKEIKPIIEDLVSEIRELKEEIKKLDKQLPEITKIKGDVKVENLPDVTKVEITNQKDVVFPDTQKVEVTNPTYVTFPETQKVEVVNHKDVEFPEVQKVKVINNLESLKINNIPLGDGVNVDKEKANPSQYIIVRLTDGQQFITPTASVSSQSGGGGSYDVWIREEYTYTTVSGSQVPYIVKKWSDNRLLTETYEYDGNANPVKKFRSIEPYGI